MNMKASVRVCLIAFLTVVAMCSIVHSDSYDIPTVTSIWYGQGFGETVQITEVRLRETGYILSTFEFPESHVAVNQNFNLTKCVVSNRLLDPFLASLTKQEDSSISTMPGGVFRGNYIIVGKPFKVLISATLEPGKDSIGSRQARSLGDELLRIVSNSDCAPQPVNVTNEARKIEFLKMMTYYSAIPELGALRPFFVAKLPELGVWDSSLLRDKNPVVRRTFVLSIDQKHPKGAASWLSEALDDSDIDVVFAALLGISDLPLADKSPALRKKILLAVEKWKNEKAAGELTTGFGFEFPIRDLGQCVLKRWSMYDKSLYMGYCFEK